MGPTWITEEFSRLSTPLVADACVRMGIVILAAPQGLRPSQPGQTVAGRVLPVRHYGSVDVFLEAYERAAEGDVIVIDNGGRNDEGCVGDLTVLEAQSAGLAGMVVWGVHRDAPEIAHIDFPLFSYGTFPPGPSRLDPRGPEALVSARFGNFTVDHEHAVFADDDGAVFVPWSRVEGVLATATKIRETERQQAELIRSGNTLRQQFGFSEYLERRAADPSYTFRQHLRSVGGAIEE